jgi:hypothetical protein
MKKVLPVLLLAVMMLAANSSGINQFTLCQDSFASSEQFLLAIAADTAMGYICTSTGSTYNQTFCSNKPGETYYPTYYDMGGRLTCTEK